MPDQPDATNALNLLDDLIARARKAGADDADCVMVKGVSMSAAQRLGEPERIERSEGADIGLRILKGKRQAVVSSTDFSPQALSELIERGLAMAENVPEDPYCGLADRRDLADPENLAKLLAQTDICDMEEPTPETLSERARTIEDAARAVKGVNNSEGAEASWGMTDVAMAASNGFSGAYSRSSHGIIVEVLAGEGTEMERDYEYLSTIYATDLGDIAALGRNAGERAVKRLHPRKVSTTRVPIIFDPRVSNSIVGHLATAINGSAIARKTSFLKESMGKKIFSKDITIVDDPFRRRGLGSKPVDGEGIAPQQRNIIDNGVLTSWFLDLNTARQLNLKSTGHAARGTGAPPSPRPTNLYLEPGTVSPAEMIADIDSGLYVTEVMGTSISINTGDYSRGAGGFWIENGEIAYPVSEITIASNLSDMFSNLTAADDLNFRFGTNAPTLRIDGMTVAGI